MTINDDITSTYPSTFYSLTQQKWLVITPMVSGFASILGSSVILNIILRDWRQKLSFTYYRILFAMSIMDVISSLNFAVGAFVNPRGVIWGAVGNSFTCSLHGFIVELCTAVPLYYSALSVYYLLVLRFKMSPSATKKAEIYFHAFAILVPLSIGIAAWSREWINPVFYLAGTCYIYPYPPRCRYEDDLECTKGGGPDGEGAYLLSLLAISTTFIISIVVMSLIMAVIVRHIRLEERPAVMGTDGRTSRSRQTRIQALLYIAAFFFTYLPAVVNQFAEQGEDVRKEFVWAMVFKIITPLQGFFNCIVFARPRYIIVKLRREREDTNTEKSSFWLTLYHVIFKDLSSRVAATEDSFAPELSVPEVQGERGTLESSLGGASNININNFSRPANSSKARESIRDRAIRQAQESMLRAQQQNAMISNDSKSCKRSIDDDSLLHDDDEEMASLRRIFFSY